MSCGSWLWNDSIVAESPVSANQLDRSAVNFSLAGVVHAELRLVARADAVVAEVESHLHLGRFKAAQIFREVVVAVTQCLAKHHSICGCFCGSSGGVRAQHKRGFTPKHGAAKNHL